MIAIGLLIAVAACNAKKDAYIIEGALTGIDTGRIILANYSEDDPIADTAVIKNGKFILTGKLTTPEVFSLYIDDAPGSLALFLVNDKITIAGDAQALDKARVTGPTIVMDAQRLLARRDSILTAAREAFSPELFDELESEAVSPARRAEIQALYEQALAQITAAGAIVEQHHADYVKTHPASPLSAYLIVAMLHRYSAEELRAEVARLHALPELRHNRFVEFLQSYVEMPEATIVVGQPAPDFTQNDPNDQPTTFSSIYQKNKLTMIDFWASWCGPCRKFNPSLVKLYEKYRSRGFEIIGVSFDREKDDWLAAIADDRLSWPQVSSLQGGMNPVGRLYRVSSIPQNVFVDTDGVIVAIQVEGDRLDDFLREQLK